MPPGTRAPSTTARCCSRKDLADLDLTGTYVMDRHGHGRPGEPGAHGRAVDARHADPARVAGGQQDARPADGGVRQPGHEPGVVDIYDVSQDCRTPVLRSSTPLGILLGHESGLAPDGRTFYVSSLSGGTLTAIDVSDPALPRTVWVSTAYEVHGMNLSDDGNRLYLADNGRPGLTVLDVSQVQSRQLLPQVREVSHVSWPEVSIPQNVLPATIQGKPFLVEIDEFARSVSSYDPDAPVGAGRMIDISDETAPRVVSDLRLEVNEPEARAGKQKDDPQAQNGLQGYAGHYCAVPSRVDPGIVACSFILSGLRVFDIRDPYRPKEIAYYNAPVPGSTTSRESGAYAMSAPAFVPERDEIWYSDGNSGFHVVRLPNGVRAAAVAATVSRAALTSATAQRRVASLGVGCTTGSGGSWSARRAVVTP
jgi:hypothetical protein